MFLYVQLASKKKIIRDITMALKKAECGNFVSAAMVKSERLL